ncbi:MAG: hypothetical protein R3E90_10500 [Marinicella sp.]
MLEVNINKKDTIQRATSDKTVTDFLKLSLLPDIGMMFGRYRLLVSTVAVTA